MNVNLETLKGGYLADLSNKGELIKTEEGLSERTSSRISAEEIHGSDAGYYLGKLGYFVTYDSPFASWKDKLLKNKAWLFEKNIDESGKTVENYIKDENGKPYEFKTSFNPKGEDYFLSFLKNRYEDNLKQNLKELAQEKTINQEDSLKLKLESIFENSRTRNGEELSEKEKEKIEGDFLLNELKKIGYSLEEVKQKGFFRKITSSVSNAFLGPKEVELIKDSKSIVKGKLNWDGSLNKEFREALRGKYLESKGEIVEESSISLSEEIKTEKYRPITQAERKVFERAGGFIVDRGFLDDSTIESREKAGIPFRFISTREDRLLKQPSIRMPFVIFPDPKEFYVPFTDNKSLEVQTEIVRQDGEKKVKELGLKEGSFVGIIPVQASTLVDAAIKYFNYTKDKFGKGIWLFGKEYGYVHGVTKNVITESGSLVANVGYSRENNGLIVDDWFKEGRGHLKAVRIMVAVKN